MIKSLRATALLAAASVTALLVLAPPASATSPNNTGSNKFAGLVQTATTGTVGQAIVRVPGVGTCVVGQDSSVGSGAILQGTTGMIGAAVYSECVGGVLTTQMVEYNYNQWAYFGYPNMVQPGDVITLDFQPAGGTNYTTAMHVPAGTGYVTGPIGTPSSYSVGIWPRQPEGAPSSLPTFGTLNFSFGQKTSGFIMNSAVDLVTKSGTVRATTGSLSCWGSCSFNVSYQHS